MPMKLKVGIPRALFFYNFYPLWKTFFAELGAEVVVSPPTNKRILDAGVRLAPSEVCLPVKTYLGHVYALKDKVDLLFVPRLVSLERDAYTCPKFMGLPDMVKHALPELPPLLSPLIDVRNKPITAITSVLASGWKFSHDVLAIWRAHKRAVIVQEVFDATVLRGVPFDEVLRLALDLAPAEFLVRAKRLEPPKSDSGIAIAVLGHEYNLHDPLISQHMIKKLQRMGVRVYTQQMLSAAQLREKLSRLRKGLFWTFEREILGAAFHFLESPEISGIVNVASFECGPDSMLEQLVQHEQAKVQGPPILKLTLDEHTGEAALDTRLEAFVDMLKRRQGK